jgi:hypothetical protein
MSDTHHDDDRIIEKHLPEEGFDATEPEAKSIWAFAIGSLVLLVVLILAVQVYFEGIWNQAVEKQLAVPGEEVGDLHNLENWRLTHYEYTDPSKTAVRIPFEEARKAFLEDAKAGKTFYPGKPTEPKPEVPDQPAAAPGAAPGQAPGQSAGQAPGQTPGQAAPAAGPAAGKK